MKKFLFITIALVVIIISSCKKDDYTNPDNLFGTEWKTFDTTEGDYGILTFKSNTIVEYGVKEPEKYGGEFVTFGDGTYSVSENKIYIDARIYYQFTGTIDGKIMKLVNRGKEMTFTLQ